MAPHHAAYSDSPAGEEEHSEIDQSGAVEAAVLRLCVFDYVVRRVCVVFRHAASVDSAPFAEFSVCEGRKGCGAIGTSGVCDVHRS